MKDDRVFAVVWTSIHFELYQPIAFWERVKLPIIIKCQRIIRKGYHCSTAVWIRDSVYYIYASNPSTFMRKRHKKGVVFSKYPISLLYGLPKTYRDVTLISLFHHKIMDWWYWRCFYKIKNLCSLCDSFAECIKYIGLKFSSITIFVARIRQWINFIVITKFHNNILVHIIKGELALLLSG